jgi:aspartokinase/homoserine dehydrogenase 1
MTYEEAMEMSHFSKSYSSSNDTTGFERIPLWIRNTFRPESKGTLISTVSSDHDFLIKGISSIDDIALLTLQGSGMVGVAEYLHACSVLFHRQSECDSHHARKFRA